MSVCVEQRNTKNNQFSQSYPDCEKSFQFFQIEFKKINLIKQLLVWKNRSRQRKKLAKLDARMLADIGYTSEQARVEISKPFWK